MCSHLRSRATLTTLPPSFQDDVSSCYSCKQRCTAGIDMPGLHAGPRSALQHAGPIRWLGTGEHQDDMPEMYMIGFTSSAIRECPSWRLASVQMCVGHAEHPHVTSHVKDLPIRRLLCRYVVNEFPSDPAVEGPWLNMHPTLPPTYEQMAAGERALIIQNKGGGHGEIGYHLALNLAKEKGLKVGSTWPWLAGVHRMGEAWARTGSGEDALRDCLGMCMGIVRSGDKVLDTFG
jgi:hypothetical protein